MPLTQTTSAVEAITARPSRKKKLQDVARAAAAILVLVSSVFGFAEGLGPAPAPTVATLSEPYGVAVDKAGQVYVTNLSANTFTVYNKALKLVGTVSTGMNVPEAIAIGTGGNIYVGNTVGNNITIYGPNLVQFATITDALLQSPTQIFLDRNNDIWVLDAPGVVHLYLDTGAPISYVYLPGTTAIAEWDSAKFGDTWTAWGPDGSGGHHANYQNLGEALHNGLTNLGTITSLPPAIAVTQDAQGNHYLIDSTHSTVWFVSADFSTSQQILLTFGPAYGIAVDSLNKRLYISEPTLNQVAVYSTTTLKLIGNIK